MTGFRGQPCSCLHQDIEMTTGHSKYYCLKEGLHPDHPHVVYKPRRHAECTPGTWCPIMGSGRYHIVKEANQ